MEITRDIKTEPAHCVVCRSTNGNVVARGKDYLHASSDQDYEYFECAACGHLYLNPRPSIEEIPRIYPTDYVTFAGTFSDEQTPIAKLKDAVLVSRFRSIGASLPTNMKVLDIGCGDAQFLIALRRQYPHARLDGLDWYFSPAVLDNMKSANVNALTGTIEAADLSENSYDAINMNQLIEHVWDVKLVLDRCYRALKPGGVLAIETPNRSGYDRTFFKSGAWGGYYWPRHLNLFSQEALRKVVEESSFRVTDQQNLLAPPCWITSTRVSLQRAGYIKLARMISDTNLVLLAGFAVVDKVATALGFQTSNQKLIARKPS